MTISRSTSVYLADSLNELFERVMVTINQVYWSYHRKKVAVLLSHLVRVVNFSPFDSRNFLLDYVFQQTLWD